MRGEALILDELNKAGKEAYLVGGCVRDLLLGKEPNDFDITTNALPHEIKEIFTNYRTVDTGLRHGTVTVLVDQVPYEVTTYRLDGDYSDGRHPDSVRFTGRLIDDLSRRDFTVNAMAMNRTGEVIDPFGGREDLERRLIRCVGYPEKRFSEDYLRILRAMRFSSVLGFEIEKRTADSAARLAKGLCNVSAERTFSELKKMLGGDCFKEVFLQNREVFSTLIPELAPIYGYDQNNPHHCHSLDVHTAIAVASSPAKITLRLAALLHDIGKPFVASLDDQGVSHFYGHAAKSAELAKEILERFRCDNATKNDVLFLIAHHDAPPETDEQQVLRRLSKYGERLYRDLVDLRRADNLGQSEEYHRSEIHDRCIEMLDSLLRREKCFSLADLAVDGDDLLYIGCPKGKTVGDILRLLLDAVLSSEVENEKQALLAYARRLFPGERNNIAESSRND